MLFVIDDQDGGLRRHLAWHRHPEAGEARRGTPQS
jgi:hypothetical protein